MEGEVINRKHFPFWSLKMKTFSVPSQALALSKRARDVTAPPRRSEPLRSKVGGPKRSSPYFAGWDRLGIAVYSLQLIVIVYD